MGGFRFLGGGFGGRLDCFDVCDVSHVITLCLVHCRCMCAGFDSFARSLYLMFSTQKLMLHVR